MKNGHATPFEGCDPFQFQVFVLWLHKLSGGNWWLSLSGRLVYYCHPTVKHHMPSVTVRVIPYLTFSYLMENISKVVAEMARQRLAQKDTLMVVGCTRDSG